MWMSNILILVDHKNADHNTLADLTAAVVDSGATIYNVDEHNLMIEAAIPAHQLPIVAAMEGVAYVRCLFNYMAGRPAPIAA